MNSIFGIPNMGVPNAGVPGVGAPGPGIGKFPFGGFNLAGLPFGNLFGNPWILIVILGFFLLPRLRTFGTFFNKNIILIFLALLVFLSVFAKRK